MKVSDTTPAERSKQQRIPGIEERTSERTPCGRPNGWRPHPKASAQVVRQIRQRTKQGRLARRANFEQHETTGPRSRQSPFPAPRSAIAALLNKLSRGINDWPSLSRQPVQVTQVPAKRGE